MVLFDFDGTVGDTIPLIVASYHHAIGTVTGLTAEEHEVRSWIGRPLLPVFEERYPGRAEELIRVYREWNLAHHDDLIEEVEGMARVIEQLDRAGVRTGVVSSKKAETVRLGIRALGLEGRIDVLAGQDETSRHKPDPEPLLYAAAVLGVEPAECVYVGDAVVDVQAARAAGMAAVAVTWGAGVREVLEEAQPYAVVDDAAALAAVLLPGARP